MVFFLTPKSFFCVPNGFFLVPKFSWGGFIFYPIFTNGFIFVPNFGAGQVFFVVPNFRSANGVVFGDQPSGGRQGLAAGNGFFFVPSFRRGSGGGEMSEMVFFVPNFGFFFCP